MKENGDLCALCLGLTLNGRVADQWPVIQGASGHWYQVLNSSVQTGCCC